MTENVTAEWPRFERDTKSAAFFDAAARGELLIKRCGACGQMLAPEVESCAACGSDELDWAAARGEGAIVSWTVVHRAPNAAFAQLVPYTIAIVELSEGPWLYARLQGGVPSGAGQPVQVRFESLPDGEHYPTFELRERKP